MTTPKPTTHAKVGCTFDTSIAIPLNYQYFGKLMNEARMQHGIPKYFRDPRPELQDAEKSHLLEALFMQVEAAFEVLKLRMTCRTCDEVHVAPKAIRKWEELVCVVDEVDIEEVTEKDFRDWLNALYEIGSIYLAETHVEDVVEKAE